MTAETMSSAAISPLSLTCWLLEYRSGEPVDTGDGIPHFDTEQDAEEAAAGYTVERLGRPAPKQLDGPCFVARARCGYLLDEDGSMVMHHESEQEAAKMAADYGWVRLPTSEYRCAADCDDCTEAAQP